MGGKLSKKKKGYNVNDEKTEEKDPQMEGASAEENEAPKDRKQEAPAAKETPEGANDTAGATKEATPVADNNATVLNEEEKSPAPVAKEEKQVSGTKAEPAKSPEASSNKTEQKPAPVPAPEKEPAKDTIPASKVPAPAKDSAKANADAKKTEAASIKGTASVEPITTEISPTPSKEQTVEVQE